MASMSCHFHIFFLLEKGSDYPFDICYKLCNRKDQVTDWPNDYLWRHLRGMATPGFLVEQWLTFISLVTAMPAPRSSRSASS